jgi:hypothetical protein
MFRKFGRIFFVFIFLSVNLLFFSYASVVRIDQPKVRMSIDPGSAKTGSVKVENLSDQALDVKVYLEDWYYLAAADGTKDFKPSGTLPLSCASWITFVPAEFTIPAFGKKTLNYTVNVPKNASGGHYAVMFFETALGRQQQSEGVAVNVLGRIGSLFYIEPQGTINKACVISNLALNKGLSQARFELNADFANTGNVDITATGNYYMIDKKGIVYARGEFNEIYTFPYDKAKLKATWNEALPSGTYDIVITLNLGGRSSLVKEAQVKVDAYGEIVYLGSLK